jgi:conjugative transfer signal peptidase TraF
VLAAARVRCAIRNVQAAAHGVLPAAALGIHSAEKRQYREPGVCADYGSPLLKPIAASEGDRVELSSAGIVVNGRPLPNTAPRVPDSMGRPLEHYPFGTYVVQHGEVWVASSWNYKSFDSRYFGPVRLSAIRQYLRPVCVWGRRNE